MAFDLGQARGEIVIDARGATRGIREAQGALNGLGQSTQTVGFGLSALGASLIGIGGAATLGIGAAVREAANFEEALANVATISDDVAKRTEFFGQKILGIAQTTNRAASDLASAFYQIVSAAIDGEKGLFVLEAAAQAANAGLTDTTTAANILTATLNSGINGINLTAITTQDLANINDTLFQTVNRGVFTYEQLAKALGDSLPLASGLGVNLTELGAAFAIITRNGQTASEASTQINAVFSALLKPSTALQSILSGLGYESGQAAIDALGFAGALEAIEAAITASGAEVDDFSGNIRAVRGYLALTNSAAGDFANEVSIIGDSAGATNRALEQQQKTFTFALNAFRNALERLAISVGTTLLPILTRAVNFLTRIVNAFERIPAPIKAALTIIVGLAGAMTVLLGVIAVFASQLIAIAAAFNIIRRNGLGLKGALGGLLAPVENIGNSVAGLTTSSGGATRSLSGFRGALNRIIGPAAGASSRLNGTAAEIRALERSLPRTAPRLLALSKAMSELKVATKTLPSAFGKLAANLAPLPKLLAPLPTSLTPLVAPMSALADPLKAVGAGFRGMSKVGKDLPTVLAGIKAPLTGLVPVMQNLYLPMQAVGSGFRGISRITKDVPGHLLAIESPLQRLLPLFSNLSDPLKNIGAGFRGIARISDEIPARLTAIDGPLRTLTPTLTAISQHAKDAGLGFAAMGRGVKDLPTQLPLIAQPLANLVAPIQALAADANKAGLGMAGVGRGIKELDKANLPRIVNDLYNLGPALADVAVQAGKSPRAFSQIGSGIKNMAAGLPDVVNGMALLGPLVDALDGPLDNLNKRLSTLPADILSMGAGFSAMSNSLPNIPVPLREVANHFATLNANVGNFAPRLGMIADSFDKLAPALAISAKNMPDVGAGLASIAAASQNAAPYIPTVAFSLERMATASAGIGKKLSPIAKNVNDIALASQAAAGKIAPLADDLINLGASFELLDTSIANKSGRIDDLAKSLARLSTSMSGLTGMNSLKTLSDDLIAFGDNISAPLTKIGNVIDSVGPKLSVLATSMASINSSLPSPTKLSGVAMGLSSITQSMKGIDSRKITSVSSALFQFGYQTSVIDPKKLARAAEALTLFGKSLTTKGVEKIAAVSAAVSALGDKSGLAATGIADAAKGSVTLIAELSALAGYFAAVNASVIATTASLSAYTAATASAASATAALNAAMAAGVAGEAARSIDAVADAGIGAAIAVDSFGDETTTVTNGLRSFGRDARLIQEEVRIVTRNATFAGRAYQFLGNAASRATSRLGSFGNILSNTISKQKISLINKTADAQLALAEISIASADNAASANNRIRNSFRGLASVFSNTGATIRRIGFPGASIGPAAVNAITGVNSRIINSFRLARLSIVENARELSGSAIAAFDEIRVNKLPAINIRRTVSGIISSLSVGRARIVEGTRELAGAALVALDDIRANKLPAINIRKTANGILASLSLAKARVVEASRELSGAALVAFDDIRANRRPGINIRRTANGIISSLGRARARIVESTRELSGAVLVAFDDIKANRRPGINVRRTARGIVTALSGARVRIAENARELAGSASVAFSDIRANRLPGLNVKRTANGIISSLRAARVRVAKNARDLAASAKIALNDIRAPKPIPIIPTQTPIAPPVVPPLNTRKFGRSGKIFSNILGGLRNKSGRTAKSLAKDAGIFASSVAGGFKKGAAAVGNAAKKFNVLGKSIQFAKGLGGLAFLGIGKSASVAAASISKTGKAFKVLGKSILTVSGFGAKAILGVGVAATRAVVPFKLIGRWLKIWRLGFKALISPIKLIILLIRGLTAVLFFLVSPFGVLLAAVGLFVAAFLGNWFGLRDKFSSLIDGIVARFNAFVTIFKEIRRISSIFSEAGDAASTARGEIQRELGVKWLAEGIGKQFGLTTEATDRLRSALGGLQANIAGLRISARKAEIGLSAIFSIIANGALGTANVTTALRFLGDAFGGNAASAIIQGAYELRSALFGADEGLNDTFSNNALSRFIRWFKVENLFTNLAKAARSFARFIRFKLFPVLGQLIAIALKTAAVLVRAVNLIRKGDWEGAFREIGNGIKRGIIGIINSIENGSLGNIADTIRTVLRLGIGTAIDIGTAIISVTPDLAKGIWGAAGNAYDWLKSKLLGSGQGAVGDNTGISQTQYLPVPFGTVLLEAAAALGGVIASVASDFNKWLMTQIFGEDYSENQELPQNIGSVVLNGILKFGGNLATNLLGVAKSLLSPLFNAITAPVGDIKIDGNLSFDDKNGTAGSTFANSVIDYVVSALGYALNDGKNVVKFLDWVNDLGDRFGVWLQSFEIDDQAFAELGFKIGSLFRNALAEPIAVTNADLQLKGGNTAIANSIVGQDLFAPSVGQQIVNEIVRLLTNSISNTDLALGKLQELADALGLLVTTSILTTLTGLEVDFAAEDLSGLKDRIRYAIESALYELFLQVLPTVDVEKFITASPLGTIPGLADLLGSIFSMPGDYTIQAEIATNAAVSYLVATTPGLVAYDLQGNPRFDPLLAEQAIKDALISGDLRVGSNGMLYTEQDMLFAVDQGIAFDVTADILEIPDIFKIIGDQLIALSNNPDTNGLSGTGIGVIFNELVKDAIEKEWINIPDDLELTDGTRGFGKRIAAEVGDATESTEVSSGFALFSKKFGDKLSGSMSEPSVKSGIGTAVSNLIAGAATVASNKVSLFTNAGRQLGNGLAIGLSASTGAVVAAAIGVANAANNAFSRSMRIQSPSKVWSDFGSYMGEGLAVGMGNSGDLVARASDLLASMATPTAVPYGSLQNTGAYGASQAGPVFNNAVIYMPNAQTAEAVASYFMSYSRSRR